MNSLWTVQDAKNRFSEVIEHTLRNGPQTITRRGKETTVMVSINMFRMLSGATGDLVKFFENSPLSEANLDLKREKDYGRSIDL